MSESNFHPGVSRWLEQTWGAPTPCQIQAWSSIKAGKRTLVAAPTGSGKTLAAFLCAIDDLVRLSVTGVLEDSTAVLYVSPLKALSNDIEKNRNVPLESIHRSLSVEAVDYTPIRAAVRTGDTPQAARAAPAAASHFGDDP
jgi:ATP-dependent helicase Lhr and Lhr-like helicase